MERRYLVNDVLDAMKKDELKVYYQPKYDATTGRLKSAEALVRWIQEDGNGTEIPENRRKTTMKKITALFLAVMMIMVCCAAAEDSGSGEEGPAAPEEQLSGMSEAREMVINYGAYGEEANERNAELSAQMQALNPENAAKWKQIMDLWKTVNSGLLVHENVLPDGLPDTDELCIVALGFQLNPDGSMRDELIERLRVLLNCAEKYPNAWIICTGGGTAAENEEATEAGRMAEWLAANGVSPDRILVEDQSKTTAQNAKFSFDILEENCPQVRQLAIVSSDYHIATGTLLFEAESILRAGDADDRVRVVSNAAYKAPSGNLPVMFQAGALIELSGDEDLAFRIYFDTYDIHELPARK